MCSPVFLSLICRICGQTSRFCSVHFCFLFSFWPCHMACGILVPRPGLNLFPPAIEVWSLNNWPARSLIFTFSDSFFTYKHSVSFCSSFCDNVFHSFKNFKTFTHTHLKFYVKSCNVPLSCISLSMLLCQLNLPLSGLYLWVFFVCKLKLCDAWLSSPGLKNSSSSICIWFCEALPSLTNPTICIYFLAWHILNYCVA